MREIRSRETLGEMRNAIIAVTMLATSGCSWIFMTTPESSYAADTQPQCDEGKALPVFDTIFALLSAADLVAGIAGVGTSEEQAGNVIGGGAGLLIHSLSASSGFGWASECSAAKADYAGRGGRPPVTEEQERRRLARQLGEDPDLKWCAGDRCFLRRDDCANYAGIAGIGEGCVQRSGKRKPERPVPVETSPVDPRGWYCAASATVGFCVRDKAECGRMREIAGTDLSDCMLTEKAWCTEDRCFPAREACDARAANGGSGAACEERQ